MCHRITAEKSRGAGRAERGVGRVEASAGGARARVKEVGGGGGTKHRRAGIRGGGSPVRARGVARVIYDRVIDPDLFYHLYIR